MALKSLTIGHSTGFLVKERVRGLKTCTVRGVRGMVASFFSSSIYWRISGGNEGG